MPKPTKNCGLVRGPYTTRERRLLAETYPRSVDEACAALGRSRPSVIAAARRFGIKNNRVYIVPDKSPLPADPFRDETIRTLFESAPTRAQILTCAAGLGMGEGTIRRRATQLGLIIPRLAKPAWSATEDALLEKHADKTPHRIAKLFRAAGYSRSPASIAGRVHFRKLSRSEVRKQQGLLSTPEIALGLGMTQAAVSRWCGTGIMHASVRDGAGDRPLGYDIKPISVLQFMARYPERFNLRKVNQPWLSQVMALAFPGSGA